MKNIFVVITTMYRNMMDVASYDLKPYQRRENARLFLILRA